MKEQKTQDSAPEGAFIEHLASLYECIEHFHMGEQAEVQALQSHIVEVVDKVLATGQSTRSPHPHRELRFLFQDLQLVKSYTLFLRDSVYNIREAQESQYTGTSLSDEVHDLLKAVHDQWFTVKQAVLRQLEGARRIDPSTYYKWGLQQSPWPTFSRQFQEIVSQCNAREQNHAVVVQTADALTSIRHSISDDTAQVHQRMLQTIKILDQAESILSDVQNSSPEKIIEKIKELEGDAVSADDLSPISTEMEPLFNKLPQQFRQFSTTDSAEIAVSQINLKQRVQRWIESEVTSYLIEASSLTQLYQSDTLRALANARNRVQVIDADIDQDIKESLGPVVQSIVRERNRIQGELDTVEQLIHRSAENVNKHIHLARLMQRRDAYLDGLTDVVPRGVDQVSQAVRGTVTDWLSRPFKALRTLNRDTQIDQSLTVAERLVRYFRYYETDQSVSAYSSIFRIKGFIGDSFIAGRTTELAQIASAVDDWRAGYRGTLYFKGERYAGKSLMGELLATRHFTDNVIRLRPGESFQLNGRMISGSYNISEVLEEIRKYTITRRFLIWIDDLELWRDKENTVLENCQRLCKHMDQYNARFFYAVSSSNMLWNRLDQQIEVRRAFQTVIHLGSMKAQDIWEAIKIRHAATHHAAYRHGMEQALKTEALRERAFKLARYTKGNIGDALLLWAGSIVDATDDHVIVEPLYLSDLPNFIASDTALVLQTIASKRRVNEYGLSQSFGPSFSAHYIDIVRRLISVGVLHRHGDGSLELTDIISNKVGRLLEKYYPIQYSA